MSWYGIRAQEDGERAEILIYDQIGKDWFGDGVGAEELVEELRGLDGRDLDVRINSVGGLVFEGLAIFNALDRHKGRVTTHVDGLAASIASVVALAGDEVRIAENAFFMVHNAWGVTIGNRNDMLDMAETLEKLDGSIAGTYMRKTGKDEADVRAWMDAETWFSAADAKDVGLVDTVAEKREVKATFDLSKFHNVPQRLVQTRAATKPVDPDPEPAIIEPALLELAAASMRTLDRTRL